MSNIKINRPSIDADIRKTRQSKELKKDLILSKKKSEKTAKRRLILVERCNSSKTNVLTEDDVIKEICSLSPVSSNRIKMDITPSACKSYSLSSPLRRMAINSPVREALVPVAHNRDQKIKSPKRVNVDDKNIVFISSQRNRLSSEKENKATIIQQSNSFLSPSKRRKNEIKCSSNGIDISVSGQSVSTKSKEKKILSNSEKSTIEQQSSNSFAMIKAVLHNSLPDQLIGREAEQKEIMDFIQDHVQSKASASMYISGAPGTGKTACLFNVLSTHCVSKDVQTIQINCMAFQTAQKIYVKVATELGASVKAAKSFRNASAYIENQVVISDRMILLVLDEMDQLDSKNQEVLYTMFNWTSIKNSHLILIGIANSLNLTDRMLPRLQAKTRLKPKLINFQPYTREELLHILQARIQACKVKEDNCTVIEPSALQFCARKVAASSGDARKALDICRHAVEVLETKKKGVKALNDPSVTPQKVGLMQISRVITGACDSPIVNHGAENMDTDDCFPLQQKLLVCTLVLLCKNTKCREASIRTLFETYTKICKKRHVSAVSQSEFHSLCELVEARGLITVKKAKQLRQSQVKLNLQESDVEYALKGKALLSSILREGM